MVKATHGSGTGVKRLGPFDIDFSSRRLRRGDDEIPLSPKAAGVLAVLLSELGAVVTRQRLLDAVWPDVHVGEEVLTQAIAELRRALRDDARRPKFIETISKAGYRLIAPSAEAVPAEALPDSSLEFAASDAPSSLPAGPSIVVIPFQSLTDEVEARAFATGVARDASVALARARWLFVTGRGSVMTLDAEALDPIHLANRLGVRYALSGSVLMHAGRLRVSVQLCDAESAQMIWAKVFEREVHALFDVIDGIGQEIGKSVETSLEVHLRKVARLRPIEQLDAWGLYHRAEGPARYVSTPQDLENLHAVLSRAVELAPDAARISAALASLEFRRQLLFEPPTRHDALKRCMELAGTALEFDPDEPDALVPMGCALGAIGNRENGMAHLERSVALNPSSYPARVFLAWALLFLGRNADSLAHADAAERISPLDPANFHLMAIRAHALALGGQVEDAYAAAEAADLHPRSSHLASAVAAWCAGLAGRPDRARFHIERLRAVRPDFELYHYFALFPFEGETREEIARHLRNAGL